MYDHNDLDDLLSTQRSIDAKLWGLEGSAGREMMRCIEQGLCMLAETDARDYWGNHIPSRTQVQAGTKGSYEYVAERMGVEWADAMAKASEKSKA